MGEGFTSARVEISGAEIQGARGGKGLPLLLRHGYSETPAMWHRVAPTLAERATAISTDRHGDDHSATLPAGDDHRGYSKRAMAADQIEIEMIRRRGLAGPRVAAPGRAAAPPFFFVQA
jgi:haloacetate dehalogenase